MRAHGVAELSGPAVVAADGDPLVADPAEFAPAHPCPGAAEEPTFRVRSDGERLRLTGCVDTFGAERLAAMLAATPVEGSVVVLDLAGLEFADAAATRTVARWVQRLHAAAVTVHVAGAPRFFVRVWHLLAFDQVSPAVFGERPG